MEEIKAGDIMIGNWFIGYDDKPFQWGIEHFALLMLQKNAPTVDELIREPVLLTEDIMSKIKRIQSHDFKPSEFRVEPPKERQIENNYWSGFLNTSTCEAKLHFSPSYRYDRYKMKLKAPDFWFCWLQSWTNGWFLPIQEIDQLKYVHQLQNMYKLFNIELEISLTGNDLKIEVCRKI